MLSQSQVVRYCPYCGQVKLAFAKFISCETCGMAFSINKQTDNRGNYTVVFVSRVKYPENSNIGFHWVKVQKKGDKLPLLFKYPEEKVRHLNIKVSDVLYLVFPDTGFTEKEDVIFAPVPKDLQYIGYDTVEMTVPIQMKNIEFKESGVTGNLYYGTKQKVMTPYGREIDGYRGDLLPVQTTFSTLGARFIRVHIDESYWKKLQPDFELSYSHNRIKKSLPLDMQNEVVVEVHGKFRVSYNMDGTCSLSNTDDFVFTANLISLKKAVEDDQLSKRWKQVRKQIKEILALKHIISADEVQAIFAENNYQGNVEEAVKSITWRKNYDDEYFSYLRDLSKQETVYFGEDSYFFQIGNYTAQELPRAGSATYVFVGTVSEVVTKLKALYMTRTELWEAKKELPKETMYFYKGRAIHSSEETWKEKLQELME